MRVEAQMFVELAVNSSALLHYSAPALALDKRAVEPRMRQLDADAVESFVIDTGARWFDYTGPGFPTVHLILAQLQNGTIEVVAFDAGALFNVKQLHTLLHQQFIAARPAGGWGARRPERHGPTSHDRGSKSPAPDDVI